MSEDQQPFTLLETHVALTPPASSLREAADAIRVLVVADCWCRIDGLCDEVRRLIDHREAEVVVITPALTGFLHAWTSDVHRELEVAHSRLNAILARLQRHGVSAHGHVADQDPRLAVVDTLREFQPEKILLVTEDEQHLSRFEPTLFSRIAELCPEVIHVAVEHEFGL